MIGAPTSGIACPLDDEPSYVAFEGLRVDLDAGLSRYESSRVMPHHARYLFVCTNRRPDGHPKGSCAEAGSEELVPKLKAAVAELGGKGIVRACSSGCLDLCEIGASILQEPEHVAYGHVKPEDLREIAAAALRGEVVTRLVVYPPKPPTEIG